MRYAQIIKGKVHGIFEYDSSPDFNHKIKLVECDETVKQGDTYDGETFTQSEVPAVDHGTKITKLAMRNRFTFAERVAIETAAESDTTVRVIIKDFDAAFYIDLTRHDTIAAINLYESKGLITDIRAAEILTTPVEAIEVPSV